MFAMIKIPHQTPADFYIYESDDELIDAAYNYAEKHGDAYDEIDRDKAIEILSEDLHGHILVETADDLQVVRNYTGHQRLRVVSMADDIAEALGL
jgi:hypothetical protein